MLVFNVKNVIRISLLEEQKVVFLNVENLNNYCKC